MRRKEAAQGFAWNSVFTVFNRVMLPFVGLWLAGKIGADGLGVFAAVNSIYTITELFRDGGLGITFIADQNRSRGREAAYSGLALISGVFFCLLLFAGRDVLASLLRVPEVVHGVPVIAGAMFASSLGTVPISRMYKDARFFEAGMIDACANTLGYVAAAALVFNGFGFMALVWQMLIRTGLQVLVTTFLSRPVYGRIHGREVAGILRQSLANMGANIAYTVYTMGDYLLITRFLGKEMNGYYVGAYNLTNKPVELVAGPLTRTVFVALGRAQDDESRFRSIFARTMAVTLMLIVPAYALILAHAGALMHLLYSGKFDPGAPLAMILVLYLGMRALGTVAGNALVASGRSLWTILAWIPAYAVAAAGLAYVFQKPDLTQAVWALTFGAVTVYSLYLVFAWRLLKVGRAELQVIGKGLLTSIPAAVLSVVSRFLPVSPVAALGLALVLAAFAHGAAMGWMYLGSPFALRNPKRVREILDRL